MQIGLIRQAKILFLKEIKTEWRNRYAINGILVQLVSAVFIANPVFPVHSNLHDLERPLLGDRISFRRSTPLPAVLFKSETVVCYYFHTLVNPLAVLFSKMLFNTLLSITITLLTLPHCLRSVSG